MTDGKGAAAQTAPRHRNTNAAANGTGGCDLNGDGRPGERLHPSVEFLRHLLGLNVPLWVGKRNPKWPDGDEFFRPKGWPTLTAEGNEERLRDFRKGMAMCANTGGVVTVIDVDPRNGGDIEKVRALLARLGVRVFAEIASPSGGRHFYIAGHPSLPSVHSKPDNPKLPGFPGVDIQSFGCNVFLTGTQRPKYQGTGYTVVLDDLDALAEGDPAGSEAFAQWVAQQLAKGAKENAKKRGADKSDFEFERADPWTGGKPDARQQAYLDKVLEENARKVAQAKPGGRNDALYLAALKCGSLVAGAGMDVEPVGARLEAAAGACGLMEDDGPQSVYATMASGFKIGFANPRSVPAQKADSGSGGQRRKIEWTLLEDIEDAAPKWAWTFDGLGRIQIAALTLFGGRPSAGKSTAARWFAARLSRGELEGCWRGKPQKVAYIAAEETARYVLKPSLRAAGADMRRIITPQVKIAEGKYVALLADEDEQRLTEDLVRQKVSVIIVDPVMATIKSKTDIYRSNELREALTPWIRIAEAIDGIVIGIVHFIKGTTGDLIASINGGSAFGEMARCVFGFAKQALPTGDVLRVMSQGKNSCGREDLSLEFAIESKWVTVSTGEEVEVGTFVLGEESDVSASELLTPRKGPRPLSPHMQLVLNHVNRQEGPVTPMDVFRAMLARDNKAAGQMLRRLFQRGLILNPRQGEYRRLPDSSPASEEMSSSRTPEEMKK